jgi:hypothetical protein
MEILDLLAHPQISTPYVQIGFIIRTYTVTLKHIIPEMDYYHQKCTDDFIHNII